MDRRGYYNDEPATKAALDKDGWFKTGDVVVIDPEGYIQIVNRSKDVIKSGGEWISSIDVENAMMAHPDVAEAAVIGLPHPKWDERPLLIVVKKPGREPQPSELLNFLSDKLAKWQLPDEVVFVPEFRMAGPARSLDFGCAKCSRSIVCRAPENGLKAPCFAAPPTFLAAI